MVIRLRLAWRRLSAVMRNAACVSLIVPVIATVILLSALPLNAQPVRRDTRDQGTDQVTDSECSAVLRLQEASGSEEGVDTRRELLVAAAEQCFQSPVVSCRRECEYWLAKYGEDFPGDELPRISDECLAKFGGTCACAAADWWEFIVNWSRDEKTEVVRGVLSGEDGKLKRGTSLSATAAVRVAMMYGMNELAPILEEKWPEILENAGPSGVVDDQLRTVGSLSFVLSVIDLREGASTTEEGDARAVERLMAAGPEFVVRFSESDFGQRFLGDLGDRICGNAASGILCEDFKEIAREGRQLLLAKTKSDADGEEGRRAFLPGGTMWWSVRYIGRPSGR